MRRFITGVGSHGYGSQKSHNLLFVSWRTRKASGIIQFEFESLTTWEAAGVSPGMQRPENQEH